LEGLQGAVVFWGGVECVEWSTRWRALEMVRGGVVVNRARWGWNEFVIMEEHGYSHVLLASLSYMLGI
jgi:hypothetical protein